MYIFSLFYIVPRITHIHIHGVHTYMCTTYIYHMYVCMYVCMYHRFYSVQLHTLCTDMHTTLRDQTLHRHRRVDTFGCGFPCDLFSSIFLFNDPDMTSVRVHRVRLAWLNLIKIFQWTIVRLPVNFNHK